MLLWRTAKRWTYRGRDCEIQRTSVGDETLYRGLVAVGTRLPDRALDAAPVSDLRCTHRPDRDGDDESREWVCFQWSGDRVPRLREEVNELADHVREVHA